MISVVLPVKNIIRTEKSISDIERVKDLLIPSFDKFFCLDKLEEFIIICPYEDLDEIKSEIKSDKFKISFYTDEEICNILPENGWFKQQILKLAIASKIKTDHYFIFDSDMILTRHVNYESDLFVENKPVCNCVQYNVHYYWWTESCKIFKINKNFNRNEIGPNLTPNILNRHIVLEMLDHISNIHNKIWSLVLKENSFFCEHETQNGFEHVPNWHEYGIYFIYLMTWYDFKDYYSKYSFFTGNSIWKEETEVSDEFLEEAFNNPQHFVSVFQSNVKTLDINKIKEKLKKYLIL